MEQYLLFPLLFPVTFHMFLFVHTYRIVEKNRRTKRLIKSRTFTVYIELN